MNPESQRIAIAEACGFKFQGPLPYSENESIIASSGPLIAFKDLPDYLNDLNAMNEAEKILTASQKVAYADFINKACPLGSWVIFATAAQRAEAFLRTLNLWEEAK